MNNLLKTISNYSDDHLLFMNTYDDHASSDAVWFHAAGEIITTQVPGDIPACLERIDEALKQGYYVAGFLSYEAGLFFNGLSRDETDDFPLIWFGVFDAPVHKKIGRAFSDRYSSGALQGRVLTPAIGRDDYRAAVETVKNYIREGETYQVNYTFKNKFSFSGEAFDLYCSLLHKQRVRYSVFVQTDLWRILSFSPELFFVRESDYITVKPMKGTMPRGRTTAEDNLIAAELKKDSKNCAENVMIVDLLRNDLGRIAEYGTVETKELFAVERYHTLFQMTSTVEAILKADITWADIFSHLFPSGSVTGAPKIRTMRIINELERSPRHIYTGSIGYITPQHKAQFNIAIRTLLIDAEQHSGELGLGSGIVWDSDAEAEYDECLLKGKFLSENMPSFQLIETVKWDACDGFFLLAYHLERLRDSADYFDFYYDESAIMQALNETVKNKHDQPYRVRLLLCEDGNVNVSANKITATDLTTFHLSGGTAIPPDRWNGVNAVRVYLSEEKVDSTNKLFYHKTTHRALYDELLSEARANGFFDVFFCNEKGELTEGAISNIIIKKDGRFFTPPVSSGLLNGVFRRHMFTSPDYDLSEKILFPQDLTTADEVYCANSVRGLVKVDYSIKPV